MILCGEIECEDKVYSPKTQMQMQITLRNTGHDTSNHDYNTDNVQYVTQHVSCLHQRHQNFHTKLIVISQEDDCLMKCSSD